MKVSQIATLPTKFGLFRVQAFSENGREHLAIFNGAELEAQSRARGVGGVNSNLADVGFGAAAGGAAAGAGATNPAPTNVRIHSECLTGDALGSLKCDCGAQLAAALQFIAEHGGLVLYLRQEGRGIGLFNKINAYALQDGGLDTIAANHALGFGADERDYAVAAAILAHFGVGAINLLTNNPQKLTALPNVVARTPLKVGENRFNEGYLRVKKEQMGHLL